MPAKKREITRTKILKQHIKSAKLGKGLELNITKKIYCKKDGRSSQFLLAGDHFHNWQNSKSYNKINKNTVTSFFDKYFNLDGVSKSIRTNSNIAFKARNRELLQKFEVKLMPG